MQRRNQSATHQPIKSIFTVLLIAFLACLFTGCHQLESLEMKQLALQARVDNNTEKLDTLIGQIDNREQTLMAAMDAMQQEQTQQFQGVQKKQNRLDTAILNLQSTQETLTQYVDDLSQRYETQQHQVVANLGSLTESQTALQDSLARLTATTDGMQENLATLESDQTILASLFQDDQLGLDALATRQETTETQVQQLSAALDEHGQQNAQQVQQIDDLALKVSQQDAEWADTLAPIQENTQQVATLLTTLKASRNQVEQAMLEQKEQLSQALAELQGRYTQWQDRLNSIQEDVKLLRDDTLSLDDRMNQLQAIARKD